MNLTNKKSAIEQQMAKLERELKSIENSAGYKKENAVKRALRRLMIKHSCSASEVIAFLQNENRELVAKGNKKVAKTRKSRKLKIYTNPITGETVETRGGNHRVLKSWKATHHLTDINDWLVETRD